jgi:hypothetical protein
VAAEPAERKRFYAEFDRDAMLRADSAQGRVPLEDDSERADDAERGPQEGQPPPMPGGDVLLVNSTLIPLTDAGIDARKLPSASRRRPDLRPKGMRHEIHEHHPGLRRRAVGDGEEQARRVANFLRFKAPAGSIRPRRSRASRRSARAR